MASKPCLLAGRKAGSTRTSGRTRTTSSSGRTTSPRRSPSADPAHAAEYAANADAYINELTALDAWIREQVAQIPEANRRLVTEHATFGYFAARYGFEQVGAIIPSLSTGSSPSAQELAKLEDTIRASGVKAIFVGSTVSPDLSRRVADDTGVQLVPLFTDSLSAAGGGADSYLAFMRYNVTAIVEALK